QRDGLTQQRKIVEGVDVDHELHIQIFRCFVLKLLGTMMSYRAHTCALSGLISLHNPSLNAPLSPQSSAATTVQTRFKGNWAFSSSSSLSYTANNSSSRSFCDHRRRRKKLLAISFWTFCLNPPQATNRP